MRGGGAVDGHGGAGAAGVFWRRAPVNSAECSHGRTSEEKEYGDE